MWWLFVIFGLSSGVVFALAQKQWHPLRTVGLMPFVAAVVMVILGIATGWLNAGVFFIGMVISGGIAFVNLVGSPTDR